MAKKTAKRRPNNDGTAPRLRADGRWCVDVSLGFRDDNGKPDRRTVYGSSADEVVKKKNDLLARHGHGLVSSANDGTLGAWLEQWLDLISPEIADSTLEQYQHRVRKYIPESLKRLRLTAVKRADIVSFESHLAKKNLSLENRRKTVWHLRSALDKALECELIQVNPAYKVKVKASVADRAKQRRPVDKALSDSEMDAFLRAAEGDPLHSLLYLMFSLGLRIGEALGLTWDAVNVQDRTVTINQQMRQIRNPKFVTGGKEPRHTLEAGALKTLRSYRTLAFSEDLAAVLESRRWIQDAEKTLMGKAWIDTGLVFTTGLGSPLCRRNVNRTITRLCEQANTEQLTIWCDADPLEVKRHDLHGFTVSTDTLARGLGVSSNFVRVLKRREDVIQGQHWLEGEQRNGGHAVILWTEAGMRHAATLTQTTRAKTLLAALDGFTMPVKRSGVVTVRRFTSHACRHTNITGLLRDRVDLALVSRAAGHADTRVTSEIYRTITTDDMKLTVVSLEARRARLSHQKV